MIVKGIDEDLFFRINENNKEKEFIPSEKEIIISFPNVKLIINEKKYLPVVENIKNHLSFPLPNVTVLNKKHSNKKNNK